MEYLYQQTGCVFENVNLDPDAPDEDAAVTRLEEEDEGIEEDIQDQTFFAPETSTSSAASQTDAPKSEPSSLTDDSPEASVSQTPLQQSSDSELTASLSTKRFD